MGRFTFLVSGEELSQLDATSPAAERINSAMRDAEAPPQFTWVGPEPRITRTWDPLAGTRTRVAQPAKVDDPSLDEQSAREVIQNRVYEHLEGIQAFRTWRVYVTPYNPAVSGPLSFWQSGQAAVTPTAHDPPSAVSTAPLDNPVGPTTPQTRPQTASESLEDFLNRVGRGVGNFPWGKVALAGGALLGLVYLGPAISTWAQGRAQRSAARQALPARANPRRRRRRAA